jgi:hypothetical protein
MLNFEVIQALSFHAREMDIDDVMNLSLCTKALQCHVAMHMDTFFQTCQLNSKCMWISIYRLFHGCDKFSYQDLKSFYVSHVNRFATDNVIGTAKDIFQSRHILTNICLHDAFMYCCVKRLMYECDDEQELLFRWCRLQHIVIDCFDDTMPSDTKKKLFILICKMYEMLASFLLNERSIVALNVVHKRDSNTNFSKLFKTMLRKIREWRDQLQYDEADELSTKLSSSMDQSFRKCGAMLYCLRSKYIYDIKFGSQGGIFIAENNKRKYITKHIVNMQL